MHCYHSVLFDMPNGSIMDERHSSCPETKTPHWEVIRQFADTITPPNWNVVLCPEDYKYKPGTLNIWLQVLDAMESAKLFASEGPFLGRVWGPMWFTRLSSVKGSIAGAARGFEIHGDGSIGRVHIQICPHMGNWRSIVIHELAHLAATRCRAREIRAFRGDNVFVANEKTIDSHDGPLFRKALFRMIRRAEAKWGQR